jgi:hypothetical protein
MWHLTGTSLAPHWHLFGTLLASHRPPMSFAWPPLSPSVPLPGKTRNRPCRFCCARPCEGLPVRSNPTPPESPSNPVELHWREKATRLLTTHAFHVGKNKRLRTGPNAGRVSLCRIKPPALDTRERNPTSPSTGRSARAVFRPKRPLPSRRSRPNGLRRAAPCRPASFFGPAGSAHLRLQSAGRLS